MKHEGKGLSDERLDELLKAAPDLAPSASLLRAVAEIPARHPRGAGVEAWWPFGRVRRWVAVLGAALAAGAVLGVALPEFESDDDASWDALSTVAVGADISEELAP